MICCGGIHVGLRFNAVGFCATSVEPHLVQLQRRQQPTQPTHPTSVLVLIPKHTPSTTTAGAVVSVPVQKSLSAGTGRAGGDSAPMQVPGRPAGRYLTTQPWPHFLHQLDLATTRLALPGLILPASPAVCSCARSHRQTCVSSHHAHARTHAYCQYE